MTCGGPCPYGGRDLFPDLHAFALALPEDLDYAAIHGLSHEIRQKLARQRPATVGQASRIPGVTPVAVSLLLVHLKKRRSRPLAGAAG